MDVGCEGLQENLPGYIYGDLSASERRAVADHLQGCGSCAEMVSEFKGVRDLLDADAAPPMPARGDLAARVMAQAHSRRGPSPAWSPLARAALLLLGIALGFGMTKLIFPGSSGIITQNLEAMLGAGPDNPEIVRAVETVAVRENKIPVQRLPEPLAPPLDRDTIVLVDKDYRTLVDLYRGRSNVLAAFFQLRLGDYLARKAGDPRKARVEYLKVTEFVTEGKVYDLTMTRLEKLLPAEAEGR